MTVEPADVLVLGAVGIRCGADFWSPPSAVARAVLGALALAGPDGLTRQALFQAVWGSRSATARRSVVTVSIHRVRQWLRKVVDDAVGIDHAGSSYVLRLTGDTDVARFWLLLATSTDRIERLAEALELWRGQPLADVPADSRDSLAVAGLVRARLAIATECCDGLIEAGDPQRAVRVLSTLAEEHPLEESIQACWVAALAAAGRQAEALAAYEKTRRRLRAELGVDPGEELSASLVRVLRGDSPAPPRKTVPTQLPGDTDVFVGRADQLATLDSLWQERADGASPVVVVCGQGGVGKTSLALRWSHRLAAQFPDGQLFADLRGYSRGEPATAAEVLHHFVRALGCPPDEVPLDRDEAAALYRSMLSGRRVLVVLDNVLTAEQVRPLLPGAAGCAVVVTSRNRLDGLSALDGADQLDLDVLTPAESYEVLSRAIGAGPRADVEALATACGHLPLALRVAGAELVRSGVPVSAYLMEMAKLGALDALSVGVTFDLSYARLPADVRRCYRLLSLVPGRDVAVSAVADLLDLGRRQASRLLRTLAVGHLVAEHRSGRFVMHNLIKAHARARLDQADDDQDAAVRRLFRWYVRHASGASDRLYGMVRLPQPSAFGAAVSFDSHEKAASWLSDELANITAFVRDRRDLPYSWLLADAMRGYFTYRRLGPEWETAARNGLVAAERAGDLRGQAAMHLSLGGLAFYGTHNTAEASREFGLAAAFADQVGWAVQAGAAMASQSLIDEVHGDLLPGAEKLARAIRYLRSHGAWRAEVVARSNLSFAYANMGRLRQAVGQLSRLIRLCAGTEVNPSALLLENRGDAYRLMGRFDLACRDLTDALAESKRIASRFHEVQVRCCLSQLYADQDDHARAWEAADAAERVLRDFTDRGRQNLVRLALGRAYHLAGDRTRALRNFQTVLDEHSGTVDFLARINASLGLATVLSEPATAQKVIDLAEPRGYRILTGKAYLLLASIFVNDNRLDEALPAAAHGLELCVATYHLPGEAVATDLLARICRLTGRMEEAEAYATRLTLVRKELEAAACRKNGSAPGRARG
ncbi:AfsR/SARP family transcriptional regulator [Fodinicola acaciae]|uniref:AfsR/SARP family transcriptional regulator n=1 Tax=Fodinicola acaciae TaxID=2681555 RepID=UPI0013D8668E|nr:BTAD domain-containing putative transcriptional regulator [Fodinicola acaciae]